MKSIVLLYGLATMFSSPSLMAESIPQDFVEQMSKQIDYAESQQQAVWPGFHPGSMPSVFIVDDNAFAIHFKPAELPWEQLSSSISLMYFLQDSSLLPLNPLDDGCVKSVDGQQSYIDFRSGDGIEIEENMYNKYMMGRAKYYLAQEATIEPEHYEFLNMAYDRFNDPLLIKLTYLEDAALTLAQQTTNEPANDALRDAVAIHQYRDQFLNANERYYENHTMFFTGIPNFIGWTTRSLNQEDYGKMIQRTGCYPLNSLGGAALLQDCSLRGLPAFASAAFGKMLDNQSDKTWKNQAMSAFKSIPKMAIDVFGFSADEARQITELAMANPEYHWDRISKIVDHTMVPYLDSMKQATENYQNQSGIVVHTHYLMGYFVLLINAYTNDVYSQLFNVNTRMMLLTDINLKMGDNPDHSLLFEHLPYLSIHTEFNQLELDSNKSHTDFKIQDNALIVTNHFKMTARELIHLGENRTFERFQIIDTNLQWAFDGSGTINISDGSLSVRFDQLSSSSMLSALLSAKNYFQFKWNLDHLPQNKYKRVLRLSKALFLNPTQRSGANNGSNVMSHPSH